jgi:hypothetical protein
MLGLPGLTVRSLETKAQFLKATSVCQGGGTSPLLINDRLMV